MELNSQRMRTLALENDPLKMGMGWKVEDLDRPQIMAESIFGDSHLGSVHLDQFVDEAMREIVDAGGKGAGYLTTDICDGIVQRYDGVNYSLTHRDTITNMIEIHGSPIGFDGGVFVISYNKPMPAHPMGLARPSMPSIVVTGGVMGAGPDLLILKQIDAYSAMCQRGEITKEKPTYYKHNVCPSCGACSSMDTAPTMRIMAEALGPMLPGSALMPTTCEDLKEMAYKAGLQVMKLAKKGLKVNNIVTMKSFENAIAVHIAISDSTNSLLHIPAIAHELGLEIDAGTFDYMYRRAHYLPDIRPAGRWPARFFYYVGGAPAVMGEIKFMLHLDAMTVTRKTLGENLEESRTGGFYDKCDEYLKKWGLKRTGAIRTLEEPIGVNGTMTMLRRNLTPEGSVVKHSAVPERIFKAVLKAKPFDCKEDTIEVVISRKIQPGDAVFIWYEGPKGSGMLEMFYITEAISSDPGLGKTIALITNGRFSGASKGSAIGRISPEAMDGGPIAPMEEDDLIRTDMPEHVLEIVDVKGEELPKEEVERILAERRKAWRPGEVKHKKGILKVYSERTVSPTRSGCVV